MTDFWFSVLWTILIAVLSILADWLSSRLIFLQRFFATIRATFSTPNMTDAAKRTAANKALDDLRTRFAGSPAWGADLVTVALALDIACLGLSLSGTTTLTFFDRWDSPTVDRTILVWALVLMAHFVCLLSSILFRHLQSARFATVNAAAIVWMFQRGWVSQNRWAIIGNAIGILSLASSFFVIQDAM